MEINNKIDALIVVIILIITYALCTYLIAYFIPKYLIKMREYVFFYFKKRREYIKENNGNKPTIGEINFIIEHSWEYGLGPNSIANIPLVSLFFCILLIPYDIMSLVRWLLQKLYDVINIKGWLTNTVNFIKEDLILGPYEYVRYGIYDDIVDFCEHIYFIVRSKILKIRF